MHPRSVQRLLGAILACEARVRQPPSLGAVLSSRLVCEGIYEDCLWAGVPIESVADFRNFYSSVLFVFLVLYREGYRQPLHAPRCAPLCAGSALRPCSV